MQSYAFLTLLVGCQNQAASQSTSIVYTQIKDCTEQIENNNAAFSELLCPSIGRTKVEIKQQSPQYFIVTLTTEDLSVSSELEAYTLEAAMEPGKAIEWHLIDSKPKFMVFRVKIQKENDEVNEMLTLNLVTKDRICPLASVATKTTPQANEKTRDLIKTKFHEVQECPAAALTL
jgi:hypothetical protein